MPEHAIARAERSIHHVHELIQMVFTRPVAETQSVLGGLMAVFADNFSMVGTTGTLVSRPQIEQLFKGAAGTRPGLQITVSDVQVVWQAGLNVAMRYKEAHHSQGMAQARWSLALLECSDHGVVWRCLHETAIQ